MSESALLDACRTGSDTEVRRLLTLPEDAPRADCQRGQALLVAAEGGHESTLELLLGWKMHAPRADSQQSVALLRAAKNGHMGVVYTLINCPTNPAKDKYGAALNAAADRGHEGAVQWLMKGAKQDCREVAMIRAAANGHQLVVSMLIGYTRKKFSHSSIHMAIYKARDGGHDKIVSDLQCRI
jgi:ankyrin repeat protein